MSKRHILTMAELAEAFTRLPEPNSWQGAKHFKVTTLLHNESRTLEFTLDYKDGLFFWVYDEPVKL